MSKRNMAMFKKLEDIFYALQEKDRMWLLRQDHNERFNKVGGQAYANGRSYSESYPCVK